MQATAESSAPNPGSIAFVGGGNMARSLVGALIRSGALADSIAVAEPNPDLRAALASDFGIRVHDRALDAVSGAETIVLAVKPQVMKTVCAEFSPAIAHTRPLLISIAAGIRIAQLQDWLGDELPIVRAMPNTPALIGAGATGLIASPAASAAQRDRAQAILDAAGRTAWIEHEELMDTVTALSGSGPAYFFLLVEALEDAAVAQGLPLETARALATQTCLGAGRMMVDGGEAPAILRQRVTSPGGTTAAALDTFASGGLRELVDGAMAAATRRGRELSEQFS